VQVPVLCTLSLVVKKSIEIRLEHAVKRNGLDRTSINVGTFNPYPANAEYRVRS
jgi:hypothetical protein